MRLGSPVVVIAGDDHVAVLLRADKAKRPGADRLTADFVEAAIRHNPDCPAGKIPQQRRERFLQVEDDGVVIRRINAVYQTISGGLGTENLTLE